MTYKLKSSKPTINYLQGAIQRQTLI